MLLLRPPCMSICRPPRPTRTPLSLPWSGYDPDGDKQRCVHATGSLWALGALCTLGWLAALGQETPGGTWLGLACILAAFLLTLRSLLQLYRCSHGAGRESVPGAAVV